MEIATALGGLLLFFAMVWGFLRFIRWGNKYWTTTPGGRSFELIEADYKRAGITLEDSMETQVAKGTLQSVPFVLTIFLFGKPPRGALEVPDAQGGDFSLARKGDGMREFLRLGAGHALQTGDEGMDPEMDTLLAAGAGREAARELFHLGFDGLERSGGKLRAVKFFCPHLPELNVLRRALDQLRVLRSGVRI